MNCPVSRHQNALPRAQYLRKEQAGELLQNLRVMIRLVALLCETRSFVLSYYSTYTLEKCALCYKWIVSRNMTDSPYS